MIDSAGDAMRPEGQDVRDQFLQRLRERAKKAGAARPSDSLTQRLQEMARSRGSASPAAPTAKGNLAGVPDMPSAAQTASTDAALVASPATPASPSGGLLERGLGMASGYTPRSVGRAVTAELDDMANQTAEDERTAAFRKSVMDRMMRRGEGDRSIDSLTLAGDYGSLVLREAGLDTLGRAVTAVQDAVLGVPRGLYAFANIASVAMTGDDIPTPSWMPTSEAFISGGAQQRVGVKTTLLDDYMNGIAQVGTIMAGGAASKAAGWVSRGGKLSHLLDPGIAAVTLSMSGTAGDQMRREYDRVIEQQQQAIAAINRDRSALGLELIPIPEKSRGMQVGVFFAEAGQTWLIENAGLAFQMPILKNIGGLFKRLPKGTAGRPFTETIKSVLKQIGVGASSEGAEEIAQGIASALIQGSFDPDTAAYSFIRNPSPETAKMWWDEEGGEILHAGLVGALVGATMGGLGSVQTVRQSSRTMRALTALEIESATGNVRATMEMHVLEAQAIGRHLVGLELGEKSASDAAVAREAVARMRREGINVGNITGEQLADPEFARRLHDANPILARVLYSNEWNASRAEMAWLFGKNPTTADQRAAFKANLRNVTLEAANAERIEIAAGIAAEARSVVEAARANPASAEMALQALTVLKTKIDSLAEPMGPVFAELASLQQEINSLVEEAQGLAQPQPQPQPETQPQPEAATDPAQIQRQIDELESEELSIRIAIDEAVRDDQDTTGLEDDLSAVMSELDRLRGLLQPQPEVQPEVEPGAETQPDPGTQPQPGAGPEVQPETQPGPAPQPEAQPEQPDESGWTPSEQEQFKTDPIAALRSKINRERGPGRGDTIQVVEATTPLRKQVVAAGKKLGKRVVLVEGMNRFEIDGMYVDGDTIYVAVLDQGTESRMSDRAKKTMLRYYLVQAAIHESFHAEFRNDKQSRDALLSLWHEGLSDELRSTGYIGYDNDREEAVIIAAANNRDALRNSGVLSLLTDATFAERVMDMARRVVTRMMGKSDAKQRILLEIVERQIAKAQGISPEAVVEPETKPKPKPPAPRPTPKPTPAKPADPNKTSSGLEEFYGSLPPAKGKGKPKQVGIIDLLEYAEANPNGWAKDGVDYHPILMAVLKTLRGSALSQYITIEIAARKQRAFAFYSYDPQNANVRVRLSRPDSPQTVVHEIAHAVTQAAIKLIEPREKGEKYLAGLKTRSVQLAQNDVAFAYSLDQLVDVYTQAMAAYRSQYPEMRERSARWDMTSYSQEKWLEFKSRAEGQGWVFERIETDDKGNVVSAEAYNPTKKRAGYSGMFGFGQPLADRSVKYRGRFNYAMASIHEFVAAAMSDPEFQQWLDGLSHKGDTKSLWRSFVDAISKLLGIKASESSLLEQALSAIEGIALRDDRVEAVTPKVTPKPEAKPKPETKPASRPAMAVRVAGRDAKLTVPSYGSIDVQYAAVELDDIAASHIPSMDAANGFAKNPQGDRNERPYEDRNAGRASRETVIGMVGNWDASQIYSDAGVPTVGPPIVDGSGVVLGGNARTMGTMLEYEREAAVPRQAAIESAAKFGLDPDEVSKLNRPVIVRVVKGEFQRGELSRALNYETTTGKTGETDAVSIAQMLSERDATEIALIASKFETMADLFGDSGAVTKILGVLRDAKAISDQQFETMWDRTAQKVTKAGRERMESVMLAMMVPDIQHLQFLPDSIKNKMIKSMPHMLRARRFFGEAWAESVSDAIAGIVAMKTQGGNNVAEYLDTLPLLPLPVHESPNAMRLMHALHDMGPLVLLNKMRGLTDAIQNEGQGGLMGMDLSPSAMFKDLFPSEAADRIEAQGVPVRFQQRPRLNREIVTADEAIRKMSDGELWDAYLEAYDMKFGDGSKGERTARRILNEYAKRLGYARAWHGLGSGQLVGNRFDRRRLGDGWGGDDANLAFYLADTPGQATHYAKQTGEPEREKFSRIERRAIEHAIAAYQSVLPGPEYAKVLTSAYGEWVKDTVQLASAFVSDFGAGKVRPDNWLLVNEGLLAIRAIAVIVKAHKSVSDTSQYAQSAAAYLRAEFAIVAYERALQRTAVFPAFVKADRLAVYDYQNTSYDEEKSAEVLRNAQSDEMDGVLFTRQKDTGYGSSRGEVYTNQIAIFSERHIKSAATFTYDEAGNLIPLDRRFDPGTPDVRYQMRDRTDEQLAADHAAAFGRGDTAEAREIVREYGRRKGYTQPVWHGTNREFFEPMIGAYFGPKRGFRANDVGFWVSESEDVARSFAELTSDRSGGRPIVMEALAKFGNPMRFDGYGKFLDFAMEFKSGRDARRSLAKEGYDSIEIANSRTDIPVARTDWVAFKAFQVKSAEPFTYDKDGELIPLDRRFDESVGDIRFQQRISPVDLNHDATVELTSWQRVRQSLVWEFTSLEIAIKRRIEEGKSPLAGNDDPLAAIQIASGLVAKDNDDFERTEMDPYVRTIQRLSEVATRLRAKKKRDRHLEAADDVRQMAFLMHVPYLNAELRAKKVRDYDEARMRGASNAELARIQGAPEIIGITDKQAAKMLAELEAKYAGPELLVMRKAVGRLQRMARRTLRRLENSGIITKKAANELRDRFPNYVPVVTSILRDDDQFAGATGGSTISQARRHLRQIEGGQEITDPEQLSELWRATDLIVDMDRRRANRKIRDNHAANVLYRLVDAEGELLSTDGKQPLADVVEDRAVLMKNYQRVYIQKKKEKLMKARMLDPTRKDLTDVEDMIVAEEAWRQVRDEHSKLLAEAVKDKQVIRLKAEIDKENQAIVEQIEWLKNPANTERLTLAEAKAGTKPKRKRSVKRVSQMIRSLEKFRFDYRRGDDIYLRVNEPSLRRALLQREPGIISRAAQQDGRLADAAAFYLWVFQLKKRFFTTLSVTFGLRELLRGAGQVSTNTTRMAQEAGLDPEAARRALPISYRVPVLGYPVVAAGRVLRMRSAIRMMRGGKPRSALDRQFAHMLRAGVMQSQLWNSDASQAREAKLVKAIAKSRRNPERAPIALLRAMGYWAEMVTTAIDMSQRLPAFMAVLEASEGDEARAAQAGREATIDFAKRAGSDILNSLNEIKVFFRAAIQGGDQLIKTMGQTFRDPSTIVKNPGKWVKRPLASMMVASVILAIARELFLDCDEDPRECISQYDLDNNWVIPLPIRGPNGGFGTFKIPKPYGLRTVTNVAERSVQVAFGSLEPGVAAKRTLAELSAQLGPINIEGESWSETFANLLVSIVPSIGGESLARFVANRDYRGNPIYNSYARGSTNYDQGGPFTREWENWSAKWLHTMSGGAIDINPDVLGYALEEELPGGSYLGMFAEMLADPKGYMDRVSEQIDAVPLIRVIAGETGSVNTINSMWSEETRKKQAIGADINALKDNPDELLRRHSAEDIAEYRLWKEHDTLLRSRSMKSPGAYTIMRAGLERDDKELVKFARDRIMEIKRQYFDLRAEMRLSR